MSWLPVVLKKDMIAPIELHPPIETSMIEWVVETPTGAKIINVPPPSDFQLAGMDWIEWVREIYGTQGFGASYRDMIRDRYNAKYGLKGMQMKDWGCGTNIHYVYDEADDYMNGIAVPSELWSWNNNSFVGRIPKTQLKGMGELSDEGWEKWLGCDAWNQISRLYDAQRDFHRRIPEAHIIGVYNPLLLQIANHYVTDYVDAPPEHRFVAEIQKNNQKNMAKLFEKVVKAIENRRPFIIVEVTIDALRVANETKDHYDSYGEWESSEVVGRRIKLWNKYDGNYWGLKTLARHKADGLPMDSELTNVDGWTINPMVHGYVDHTRTSIPIYTSTKDGEPCLYLYTKSIDAEGGGVDAHYQGPYFPKRISPSIELDDLADGMVKMGSMMALGDDTAPDYMIDALKKAGFTTGEKWREEISQDYEESIEHIVLDNFFPDLWKGDKKTHIQIQANLRKEQMEGVAVDSSKLKELYDTQTFKKYKFPSTEPFFETPPDEVGEAMFDKIGQTYQMGIFGAPDMGLLNWDFGF